MNIDPKWHKEQLDEYQQELPHYEIYAKVLQEVLEAVCVVYAPLAIVQTRPKALASFAEKAIRRAEKFQYPSTQLTDLCGARIIANTQDEVDRISNFIENHFKIDEENSEGRKARQKTSEFGYSSYHYIVQIGTDEILGVTIPKNKIGERKAEIQVRTLLQHAWANISHDQFYKSNFKKPEYLERSMARLSALLEEADKSFSSVISGLNVYKLNYGAYMKKEDIKKELNILQTILRNEENEKNKISIALKIARIAKAACDWKTIVEYLDPYVHIDHPERYEILLEHGNALCHLHKDRPQSPPYTKGQKELEEVTKAGEGKTRIQALACLAWSYGNIPGQEKKARKLLNQAYEFDPLNPYILSSFLEYEIYCGKDVSFLPVMRHALENAIKTCRDHIDAGIELPWAYLAIGRFNLFLEDFSESLSAYAKAIHLCADEDSCFPEDIFDEELKFLDRINFGKDLPERHQWVKDLLLLGKSVSFHRGRPLKEVKERAVRKKRFQRPVVIVAGGTDQRVEAEMQKYRETFLKAFDGYKGTIISGGTTAGIPGLVGLLKEISQEKRGLYFKSIGYLPVSIPKETKVDERYDEIVYTEGNDFSPRQPLQNWIDLMAAGIKPSEVVLFGINGGKIASLEYRLALALGAKVGIIRSSGRAVINLIPDTAWWDAINLSWLPNDTMSIRAFLNPREPSMNQELLLKVGEAIHNEFLKENRYKSLDPVMMPFPLLREDIKKSNIEQAAYLEKILFSVGCGIRSLTGKGAVNKFEPGEIEIMAEMEHGRWNVERLQSGWRYGPKKDTDKKISPYLVEWAALTEEVKGYDRENVNNWPKILESVDLEIYRLTKGYESANNKKGITKQNQLIRHE